MRVFRTFLASTLLAPALGAPPAQIPLGGHDVSNQQAVRVEKKQKLHGRFLQVTDFHPDRFYQIYSGTDEDSACHRGHGPAGIYGAETSECDSPIALVNKTMEWVAKELKDKVDFVIWTGDSARHDNDEDFPRTEDQVLGLNEFMVHKMAEVFGKHAGDGEDQDPNNDFQIPIVPNLGNNDILPHNILAKGPNKWTRSYSRIWKQFIPEAQQHSFQQGGWFYVEVIPHQLAVFSLNTLYFFGSNAAADGCAARSEPGYQQMEWLRIQLQFMRDRGMKAILIGHVPPVRQEAKTSWDETCWQKYTLFLNKYRDIIVSSHYGHFNYDHFMFQDFKDLKKDTKKGRMKSYIETAAHDGDVSTLVKSDYFVQLREQWSDLPEPPRSKAWSWLDFVLGRKKDKKEQKKREKKYLKEIGGEYTERFAATFVGASVVPNLFPTMRVFEYNTTGLESQSESLEPIPAPVSFEYDDGDVEDLGKKKKKHKKKHKKIKFTIPDGPAKTAPPGPAYSPQTLSLLKYTQYFANLTYINNDFSSHFDDEDEADGNKWKEGKHKGKKPHKEPNPKKFEYEELYDTQEDKVYHLKDLTVPSLIDLARRIGDFVAEDDSLDVVSDDELESEGKGKKHKKKHKKGKKRHSHRKENEAWYTFVRRAYVETLSQDEIDEEFGV